MWKPEGDEKGMCGVRRGLKWAIPWVLPLLLGACAGLSRNPSLPINDPNEDINRHVMTANQEVLRPAAELVKAIPAPVHDRLHDLNSNLKEPRIFVNNVLQGRFEAAGQTSARFVMNSVFGLGGLFDIASREGLQQQSGDFGQTLFVWGVAEGPYVVRPYLGPSTLRDTVGSTVDMFSNPFGWFLGTPIALTVGSAGVDAADRLGQLKMAEDASIDFYSFTRSSYYQMRRAELRQALGLPAVVDSPALDDPDDDPAAAPAPLPDATRSVSAPAANRSPPASPGAPSRSASVSRKDVNQASQAVLLSSAP
jgi:phospholipid-binding lipoprotein MlaA